jgi:hypothetical protein
MAKSQLTRGLVAGKSSGLLGAGMTTNPALDNSTSTQRARALLENRARMTRSAPTRSGASQPQNGAAGRKVSGGMTIRGGRN